MEIKTIEDLRKLTKEQLINENMRLSEEVGTVESEIARLKEENRWMQESCTGELARKNVEIDALTLAIRKICKEA